ncbi:aromatic ring-hydroxylating dioxygenase subunit alpha [Phormidesmis priestleyi ULC007]|uniref:Aromatic ring-hydroxylating dioxygenase subunit alpha n=1 Tax=Phormidesmis priestleyi ULC007 TaxID=1920490 RepID=A0A2T1DDF5_9CYAN|nr:aromatic ring-hydroxylating dioxygenase subunit alpha [Phormidesmis priestleyi ULC007]PZO48856.1 MAG: aromatic ring-hydroxylating dioxygenase subunit alpha [Phormidesmis priestleyi]
MTDRVLLDDWHPLARSQDLKPGTLLRSRLMDTDLVLWRGENTAVIAAWEDRCPHRSVRLSGGKVVENTLVCSYHGLAYDPQGHCVNIPAHPNYVPPKQACVKSFKVQERYGVIFVSLGNPPQDVTPFPEWDDPTFRTYLSGAHFCRCSGLRAIENFLDVAHLPFVHAGILGEPDQAVIEDYEVSTSENGIYLHDIRVWQPDPDGTGQAGIASYEYWALRPLTASLRKETVDGNYMVLLYCVTPIGEEECLSWMWGALNYAHDIPEAEMVAFQDKVILQDVANLESHNPKRLPLDLQAEFHLPSDRASLAYRQWLKQLGLKYGAIE